MSDENRGYRIGTRAVHLAAPPVPEQRPMGLPTYRTAAFIFDSAEDYSDILNDRKAGYTYSRIDNPTADAFALGVAELEGGEAAQPFASGMAAISTVLLTFLSTGDHVVAQSQLYGGTYSMIHHVLPRFGIDSTLVDGADVDAVAAAMRPETKLVWAETLANPAMTVADIPALAELARSGGARLVVDSTFASPVVCRPLEWGADIVVHSATKYLGGHADVTGGVAVGSAELMRQVRALRIDLGGSLAPDDAFLLHRGISTLSLRVERHCANALAFAEAIARHPRIDRVDYPGLTGHPQHGLAGKLFDVDARGHTMYGAIVTIHPHGSRDAGMALCNRLRLAHVATSLGGVSTKVTPVATTTHRQLDDAALTACGIAPGTVRVSVGIEDVADLIDDFEQALDSLPA